MSLRVVTADREDFRARVVVPLPRAHLAPAIDAARPMVDVVVPVHNEERELRSSVMRLHAYLAHEFPFTARITIADNASTDATPAIAMELAADLPDMRVLRLNERERGRALAAAWLTSDARVVTYMDLDLSTDLTALLPLVAPVVSGHSQVSIGGRLALRADVARTLLPSVISRNRFFTTELLVRAKRAGLCIHEVQIGSVDHPVATPSAAPPRLTGQLLRFAAVGGASTLAYAALFWALRDVFPITRVARRPLPCEDSATSAIINLTQPSR
jgi:hypothetical protein